MKQRSHAMRLMSVFAVAAASQACAGSRPPVATTPRIELTAGLNPVQLPSAQFPGLVGAVAFNFPKTPTWGAALVGDVDASYLAQTTTAGVRVYRRNRPLFGEGRVVTGFAQILVGEATGGVQGILRSTGGVALIPSVGLDYGAGRRAFHLQVGYRDVSNSAVYDPRVSEDPIDELSRLRVVLGMTWRFRSR